MTRRRRAGAAAAVLMALAFAGACGGSSKSSTLESQLRHDITTVPGSAPQGLGPAFGATTVPGGTGLAGGASRGGTGIDGGAAPAAAANTTAVPSQGAAPTTPDKLTAPGGSSGTTLPAGATADGYVTIDATASGDPYAALTDLESLGLLNGAVAGRVVSGRLPAAALPAAQRLPSVRTVQPSGSTTN